MTPQAKFLFDMCKTIRNQGSVPVGVTVHPTIADQVIRALKEAQIDLPVTAYPEMDPSTIQVNQGAKAEPMTSKVIAEAGYDLPAEDLRDIRDAREHVLENEAAIPAHSVDCPWCDIEISVGCTRPIQHLTCSVCGMPSQIIWKPVISRHATREEKDAFDKGFEAAQRHIKQQESDDDKQTAKDSEKAK